jgi:hypothetical protein
MLLVGSNDRGSVNETKPTNSLVIWGSHSGDCEVQPDILWEVMWYCLVEIFRRFWETYCFLLKGISLRPKFYGNVGKCLTRYTASHPIRYFFIWIQNGPNVRFLGLWFLYQPHLLRGLLQGVPLATELGISLIILTPMKILHTKFEQGYVRCVRNEEECVCSVCL